MKTKLLLVAIYTTAVTNTFAQIYGIDVSYYQGTINWSQVYTAGKVFAFIKSSQGYTTDQNDTYFASNVNPAINAGLKIGAYHVAMPATYSYSNEANHFLNTAGNYIGTGYLPPALDIEQSYAQTFYNQGNSPAQLAQWINSWCLQVYNSSGVWPVLYVDRCRAADLYPSFTNGTINPNIKLWIADYSHAAGSPGNSSSCLWVGWPWHFHQYSETGSVSGISGAVDLDVFNGTLTDFNNLIGNSSTTPLCDNDNPCSPQSLTINTSGTCNPTNCSTINGSPPSPDIPYYGGSSCATLYQTSRYDDDVWFSITASNTNPITVRVTPTSNTSNFDPAIGLYQGSCSSLTQITCADAGGVGAIENLVFTPPGSGTYYIRVFSYGIGSTYSGNFSVCAFSSSTTTCTDQFESNNSANAATLVFANPLNSGSSNYSLQGNMGFAGDQDWYRVNIQACGTLTVNLSNLPLNYDLELWNSSATTALSGSYNAGTSNEQVTYTSSSSTLSNVYVKVYANSSSNFTTASCYNLQFLWSPGNCPCTPPIASISPSTATICSGNSIQLTASGGTSYSWSNGSTSSAITISPTSNTTYTVTVTNSGGCTATTSRTVNVNSNPSASISPSSASICTGGSIQLTASGGTSYAWSNGSTSSAITISPTSNTTYTVTVTNSNGCSATANRFVSVSSAPTASISPATATICSGNSIQLTASGGSSYSWSNGATTASITVSPNTNTTYTVTVSNSGCSATATASRTVNVNSSPSASISPSSASICTGGSIQLTASGGTSYAWSNGSTSSAITISPTSNTTYTVTVTNSNGCSATANRLVSVSSAPTASISPATATICSGNSIQLTASGGSSYSWSNGATTASITVSPNSNTTYTVTVSNNSCTATANRTVMVNQTPSVSINPPSVSICSGGTGTTLQATGSAQNYSWTPSTGLNTTSGQTVIANPSSNTTYTVTASNGNCSATATSAVSVSNQITASISPANPVICGNGSIILSATPGTAYTWSGPNGFSGTTQTVSVSDGGNYNVTVTNPGGCLGNANAAITVTQNPSLIVDAGTNQVIQSGDSAQLGGTPTASGGTSPYTYSWNPTTALDNSNAANPYSNPTSGSISYDLIVTDSKGCSATDNVSVTVSTGCQTYILDTDSIFVPSVSATYSVTLTVGVACPWTLIEGCSWLSFNNTAGSGTTTLTFTVDENMLTSQRTCLVNIQGVILIIKQDSATPCLPPVSDFSGVPQAIFAGNSVTFSDNSSNSPSLWEWTFTGGDPATSNAQNPTVSYSTGGLFDVTLKSSNACGNNTVTKTNYVNVIGTVGINNIDFDNSISVFPNPNDGTFKIVTHLTNQKTVKLKLFSPIGQMIYSEEIIPVTDKVEKEVSVGKVAAGIYLLQIIMNEKPTYQKLIIE